MTHLQLATLLENITGHLHTTTQEQERALQEAQQRIAASLLLTEDTGSEQLFANSDLYGREKISNDTLSRIASLAEQTLKEPGPPETRVFVRTVPVRDPQIAASMPEWAMGAKPAETFGPFLNNEGRKIWIDVFKVIKLVTLYAGTQPILLFKAAVGKVPGTSYGIVSGSVWISAGLLKPGTPADRFTGVKVKGGTLKLSEAPTMQNGKLTLTPGSSIDLTLQLVQDTDEGAAETSAYGKDARNSQFQLPETWHFTWNGATQRIAKMEIGNASCKMYGQDISFTYKPVADPPLEYNPLLQSVLIPWKASITAFTVTDCQSPFITLSGSAPVLHSYWSLAAAVLDVDHPLEAEGNGGVLLLCNKGLRAVWTGLEHEDVRLMEPFIGGRSGSLIVGDMLSDMEGASWRLELWKNEQRPYRSSTDLYFLKSAFFIFSINSAASQEFLSTLCNSDFKTDRPVKVNGEAFEIRSRSSLLMLGASDAHHLIYLYDNNLAADNAPPPATHVPPPKLLALALENAVFTVSPVSACMLFGECDTAWQQITKGKLFVSFVLYRYLPTLPDPYVGNLRTWERLFREKAKDPATGVDVASPISALLCTVSHEQIDAEHDNVDTNFHFGALDAGNITVTPGATTTAATTKAKVAAKAAPPASSPGRTKPREAPLTSFRSQGTITAAAKVTTAVLESIAIANNAFLQKLTLKTDITDVIQPEPVLTTTVTGNALNEAIKLTTENYEYENFWNHTLGIGSRLNAEPFALLDVSSNANQMGISISGQMIIVKTGTVTPMPGLQAAVVTSNTGFPFIVDGMEVKTPGSLVRSFALPQIAWEPVINLSPAVLAMDPQAGPIYFPDDGGATRIWNNNTKPVPLAPIPVVRSLLEEFKTNPQNFTIAAFTLPFGLKAISYIAKNFTETQEPDINNIRPLFRKQADGSYRLEGGIQLSLQAGNFGKKDPVLGSDSPMFPGYIIQLNNLLTPLGTPSGDSNLGHRVTEIFNNEFLFGTLKAQPLQLKKSRGVPLERMDITGYGASIFSNWLSPSAAIAQTSQAKFDVMLGRTAHEVIQVKSILYPWGIRVVRTITLFRVSTAYVYRTDSGWKAESDGKFDFSYRYIKLGGNHDDPSPSDFETKDAPYEFHPGVIRGLFNVRNIKDAPSVKEYTATNIINPGDKYVDGIKGWEEQNNTGSAIEEPVKCGPVYFDADVEIENVVQGHISKRVVSKKILGYVQVAPAGKPLTAQQLKELLALQNNSIGGDLDCVVDINNSDQQMRLNRFDVGASVDGVGNPNNPVFVVAARGNVFLPKDGSWAMVQHNAGTGEVTPLPADVTVPLIRTGKWKKDVVVDPAVVASQLLRIAHPLEILRAAGTDTINFGYLQSTATQKALFLTPAYGKEIKKLLSKTPPVFADAYRLMTGNSIFPNIGNAIDNFGKCMPMLKGIDSAGEQVTAFVENALEDGGAKVWELMDMLAEKVEDTVVNQGMSLAKKGLNELADKALKFDIPPFDIPLVDVEGLRIYIKYKTAKKKDHPQEDKFYGDGKLDFDVDSFASEMGNQWKSRLNNLSMVVDLGDMKELITIKGNFDAAKGKESGYEGGDDSGLSGLPVPEVEFSDALQPVIEILEVLAKLSQGDYAAAIKKGLKIAMSNSGEIWEYKFEAGKEIPLVRFPPGPAYNAPQTPLRLEASLGLGVYFNAALKVTTDLKELLPTAGAFLKFHGGISVMCLSVGVGSIYANGSVDVKVACDTGVGPNLTLSFAFGVQIVVGFPVVGTASVTFMVGLEMYADINKVKITALLLFRGNAELLAGLVCVTISLEARGIIERDIPAKKTEASAQVTFALDISIFLIIDISFSKSWSESRQIA